MLGVKCQVLQRREGAIFHSSITRAYFVYLSLESPIAFVFNNTSKTARPSVVNKKNDDRNQLFVKFFQWRKETKKTSEKVWWDSK